MFISVVNYVREHVRFIEYASEENLSASEMLLWYALMHQFNQRAQGNIWPEEFVRIDNDRLLSYLPFCYDALAEARNKLKQRGIIDYVPGERNKKNPTYKIVYFYPQYVKPETEKDANMPRQHLRREIKTALDYPEKPDNNSGKNCFYPENPVNSPGNIGGNSPVNSPGNIGGNTPGKAANIDINYTENMVTNRKPALFFDEDEEDDEDSVYARAGNGREAERTAETLRFQEEARAAWKEWIGEEASNAIALRLATIAANAGMERGVLHVAVEIAAARGKNPKTYVFSILNDWQFTGIRTAAQAEEYQALKWLAKDYGYGSEEWERLKEFREELLKQKDGAQ